MKLQHTLTDAQAEALLRLHPWATRHGEAALDHALEALLAAERARRGELEPITGAYSTLALVQGTLLKDEFDPSLHHEAWRVGLVLCDVRAMIRHNERLGFARGDALLAALVTGLRAALPAGAKMVRIHADAFAALLGPVSETKVSDALLAQVKEEVARALLPFAEREDAPVGIDWGLLELTLASPAHFQVLGPLVWSEAERALLVAKRGEGAGLQQRRVDLGQSLTGTPTLR